MPILQINQDMTLDIKVDSKKLSFKDKLVWTWRIWFGYKKEMIFKAKVEVK